MSAVCACVIFVVVVFCLIFCAFSNKGRLGYAVKSADLANKIK